MGAKVILYIENDASENKIFPFFMIVFFFVVSGISYFCKPENGL